MGKLLKNKKTLPAMLRKAMQAGIALLLAIVVFSAVVFYYSQSQNQNPIEPVQAQEMIGPLRVHPANPRYFTDGSGKAIYLTGSHTWMNLQDFRFGNDPEFNWTEYLDLLKDQNHNFVRLWVIEYEYNKDKDIWATPSIYQRTGPGTAYDDRLKYDLTKYNEEYFTRLKERIASAQARGIYVSVMLFSSFGSGYSYSQEYGPGGWLSHPYRGVNNVNNIDADFDEDGLGLELHTLSPLQHPEVLEFQENYVKKVINTVNEFDNVLYEIGNEMVYQSIDFQNHMIKLIQDYERDYKPKQHPVGLTAGGRDFVTNRWHHYEKEIFLASPADWISPNYVWDVDMQFDPPPTDGSKVIIADTDHLGNNSDRKWIWKYFLQGYNPIFMDVIQVKFPYNYDAYWNDPDDPNIGGSMILNRPGNRAALGYTLQFANKMDLAAMTPQPTLSTTGYCLANPSQEYLVYQPDSGSFSVTLKAGTYNIEWFNPESGKITQTGTIIVSDGSQSFQNPYPNDAVLYIKKAQNFPLGLIGHWKLDGDASDGSGYGNHGTIFGAALTVDRFGLANGAYSFDGLDDYVVTADTESLDSVTDVVTVAAWVKRSSNQDSYRVIVQRQVGGTTQEHYFLGFNNNSFRWFINTTNGYSDTSIGSAANNSEWIHMVGTYDGSEVKLYINGQEDFTVSHTGTFASDNTPITIGAGNNIGMIGEYFNGLIDEVRIYNKALSTAEVLALYQETTCHQADLNCDGAVNSADLGILKSNWGQTTSADLNQDGLIDTQDFGIMMSIWGIY